VTAYAAALLVTRQVIAVDGAVNRADRVDEPLNEVLRQEFRQVNEGALVDEVTPQVRDFEATKSLAQLVARGARLGDGVYEDTSAFDRAPVVRGLPLVRR
jgi:hypothetical protein